MTGLEGLKVKMFVV